MAGDQEKASKPESNYREGRSKKRCGLCEYYRDHRCQKVRGFIRPEMVCDWFELGKPLAEPG